MLVIALAKFPYGYYALLRIVVALCCAIIVFQAHTVANRGLTVWSVVLIVMAILFNPIFPVHLTRDAWAVIDLASAAVLVAHMLIERDRKWLPTNYG